MKKTIIIIYLLAAHFHLTAQTVNVHLADGKTINFCSDNIDYIDFQEEKPEPSLIPGQIVDMGLSVYWSTCNIGSNSPTGRGIQFSWGETQSKDDFDADNCSYYDKTKYDYISIGDDINSTEFDAATVNLGPDWRMPTKSEVEELVNKCSWEWTRINDLNGYWITATNGNSIFLPADGFCGIDFKKGFAYWTSTKSELGGADVLYKDESDNLLKHLPFRLGCSIRPVTNNPSASTAPQPEYIYNLVMSDINMFFKKGKRILYGNREYTELLFYIDNQSNYTVTITSLFMVDGETGQEVNQLEREIILEQNNGMESSMSTGPSGMTSPYLVCVLKIKDKEIRRELELKESLN